MPEIPDLEAIRHYLAPRLAGRVVTETRAPLAWLVRTGPEGPPSLVEHGFGSIERRGQYLLFEVDDGRLLVVNPMLTGRFHWVEAETRKPPMLGLVFVFDDGHELRYSDQRRMGRWYLLDGPEALGSIPQMEKMGPDALEIDVEAFLVRMRRRNGMLKPTLTNQDVIAGIGNAYSDEILWHAGLHPHRRGATLAEEDWRRLHASIRAVLEESIALVDATVQAEGIGAKEEWRQHLKVHRRAGTLCPRCGREVKGQVKGGSETNYCVGCQPLF
ncbi:MAG: hypothetical protein O2798_09150 [Chloroflexi bacterium]|nr:hypothetical protein [Chloroflexota bacterium]